MRTANPALNDNTFTRAEPTYADSDVMSIQGTVNKIGILLVLTIATASLDVDVGCRENPKQCTPC